MSSNGKCMQANPLCKTFNLNNGACTSCYPGYEVSQNTCEPARVDPNCKRFQGQSCAECYKGYFAINGNCKQANPLCQ